MREALQETANLTKRTTIAQFNATVEAEQPNDLISSFKGSISVSGNQKLPLTMKQMLLRGCVLRNTDWCVGVAVYVGEQTKLMKNSMDPSSKRSTLEMQMNKALIFLFGFMLAAVLSLTVASIIWTNIHEGPAWYLGLSSTAHWKSLLNIITYFITFSMMIPISLYVTLEMVRVAQSAWINWDIEMYDAGTDTPAKARTSNLTEELGRVKYIFADKTGTLTRNQMELLQIGVGKQKYAIKGEESDTLKDELKKGDKSSPLHTFFTALAVCHTVVPAPASEADETEHEPQEEHSHFPKLPQFILHSDKKGKSRESEDSHKKGKPQQEKSKHEIQADGEDDFVYQAASPDEGALVEASRTLGFTFLGRSQNDLTIKVLGQDQTFELLNVLEFNSNRKRMSVVVKDPEGKIYLYCKGADSSMLDRVAHNSDPDTMERFLEDFAKDGLRTLCVARRELDPGMYQKWSEDYQRASASLENREKEMDELADQIETDFELLGVTGIEDKLQDGVPDAIAALRRAHINIWVLTGDKKETAINIGYSTHLLDLDMDLISLSATDQKVREEISSAVKTLKGSNNQQKHALVIEGRTITEVLKNDISPHFLELALMCQSVICVRATPMQKAELVTLVRTHTKDITLAVGDGANDVSMIRAAHVGVGISGVEGNQALMASDYTIAQFKFLYRLLMIHGRWNYIRNCKVVKYSFYKSMTFALTQFWYSFYNGFSAQTLYDGWSIAIFNLLFTGLPVIFLGIFDQDVHRDIVFHQPHLYKPGQDGKDFRWRSLWSWFVSAAYHASAIFFVTLMTYGTGVLEHDGTTLGLTVFGVICYTLVILVVNVRLCIEIHSWIWATHFALWGSIIAWFVWLSLYSWFGIYATTKESEMYWVGYAAMSTPVYWVLIFIVPVICLLPDYTIKSVRQLFRPESAQIVREKFKLAESVMEQGDLHNLSETASLLPIRKETAALAQSLPEPIALANALARRRTYTGFAFSAEEGDLAAMQARYGNLDPARGGSSSQ
eukprot:Phypoly_transcript_01133.p1 GENE.Phypoly_transcript_01133~~Phypoly_transcript_01133.p1  ORF type:complete len:1186 (+),score=224.50 Phypoly_transcript_01133:531-3560(+)